MLFQRSVGRMLMEKDVCIVDALLHEARTAGSEPRVSHRCCYHVPSTALIKHPSSATRLRDRWLHHKGRSKHCAEGPSNGSNTCCVLDDVLMRLANRVIHCVDVTVLEQHHAELDFMQHKILIHSPLFEPELNKLCMLLLTNKLTQLS
jgi:hypothetical protein